MKCPACTHELGIDLPLGKVVECMMCKLKMRRGETCLSTRTPEGFNCMYPWPLPARWTRPTPSIGPRNLEWEGEMLGSWS